MDLSTKSQALQRTFEIAFKAADSEATVLILGESGTGKSMLARGLHQRSPRAQGAFVTVSCPSLSRELLESEMFGHAKGAFTGAHVETLGKVAAADGGTLFLDEIGELPIEIQSKLLRLLQEREYERVGETKSHRSNVRVIAATNSDLQHAVKSGRFREDLYYRLNVISVTLPPLRERTGDIPLLAQTFLREFAKENGKTVNDFTADALEALMNFSWPGNVRELRTAIEHAVVFCRGERITRRDLPPSVRGGGPETKLLPGKDLTVKEAEKQLIVRALKEMDGNRTRAAEKIGMSRRTFHRKLHEYHLEGF
jgi:NtrC-family two-component system response regulator AlgB